MPNNTVQDIAPLKLSGFMDSITFYIQSNSPKLIQQTTQWPIKVLFNQITHSSLILHDSRISNSALQFCRTSMGNSQRHFTQERLEYYYKVSRILESVKQILNTTVEPVQSVVCHTFKKGFQILTK